MNKDKKQKLIIILISVEAVSGVTCSAMILTQNHPYISLLILAGGAVASKVLAHVKRH